MNYQIAAPSEKPIVLKYCIYARKSMEQEERQALSIDSQLKEMKEIVDREKLDVVAIKTESHSAKHSGQREVFMEMVTELKAGKYNAILTWNPDRLSRNAGDLGLLVDMMDNGKLLEIRTFNQVFSNSPNEKFLLMILCSQAKLENDQKGINVKRGLRAAAAKGLWPCAYPPLGYSKSRMKGEEGVVHLNKKDAPFIKEAFRKVAYEGYSTYAIERWLKETGMTTSSGKPLNYSLVQAMLHNSFYYGYFEFPKKSGQIYKGAHKPAITKKLFNDAQEAIAQKERKKRYRKSKTAPFGFLHLIRCGTCSSGITAEEKYKTLKSTGEEAVYRYYVCCRNRNRDCREKYISETQLLEELYKILDVVELDEIGMREMLESEIEKWYKVRAFVQGKPVEERTDEQKEYDLRKYAKIIFEEGRNDEQREILKYVKGRLILRNKRIYLDTVPEEAKS
ncbi:MAG: recombinase family protein [Candidatus Nomurabacteria bacterium]|nr:MAG: recombinase family protein [Candidatus Nomurabacteria bacterium]